MKITLINQIKEEELGIMITFVEEIGNMKREQISGYWSSEVDFNVYEYFPITEYKIITVKEYLFLLSFWNKRK